MLPPIRSNETLSPSSRNSPFPNTPFTFPISKTPREGQKSKVKPLTVSYTNTHGSIGNSPAMDEEPDNWPIPMKHRDEFDLVKLNYEASPLRLYRGNSLVESADVNEALTGAVVEVFFVIRYYYLRDKIFDTLRADIQQIKILKLGTSIACSGFKPRNAREEPFDIVKTASSSAHAKLTNRDELRRYQSKWKEKGRPVGHDTLSERRRKERNSYGHGRFVLVVHSHIALHKLRTFPRRREEM
jgi:hypothetical protein